MYFMSLAYKKLSLTQVFRAQIAYWINFVQGWKLYDFRYLAILALYLVMILWTKPTNWIPFQELLLINFKKIKFKGQK